MVLSSSTKRLTGIPASLDAEVLASVTDNDGLCPGGDPISVYGIRPGRFQPALFQLDGRAGGFELLLDLLCLVLIDAFLDGLWSALDQVLGLLEAEAGDR